MKKILLVTATALLSATLVVGTSYASACDKDGKKDKKTACTKGKDGKACCNKTATAQSKSSGTMTVTTANVVSIADPAAASHSTTTNAKAVDVVLPATDAPVKAEKK